MRGRDLKTWIGMGLATALCAAWASGAQAQGQAAGGSNRPVVRVMPDRPDGVYRTGEEVRFVITIPQGGKPGEGGAVECVIKDDCGAVVSTDAPTAQDAHSLVARAKLSRPGVLRCRVTFRTEANEILAAQAGAAIDPFQIKPGQPAPDDFDAFWADQKRKQSAIELKPRMTPAEWADKSVECFDVQVPCLAEKPTSGYYARPLRAKPKSLPAALYVQGAGTYSAWIGNPAKAAAKGMIALEINAHGVPNGKPRSFYDELGKGELKDYRSRGMDSRETWYFLGMYLRLMRAMDFLCAQPEWDGKVLIVIGSSQGGSQAIAAAGLDPRVSGIVADVPGHCDLLPRLDGRQAGWPVGVATSAEQRRDEKIRRAVRYFDSANFATRTGADVTVGVGLIDDTCPPTGVFAAYNAFKGRKEISIRPDLGHANSPAYTQAQDALIARQTGRVATTRPAAAPSAEPATRSASAPVRAATLYTMDNAPATPKLEDLWSGPAIPGSSPPRASRTPTARKAARALGPTSMFRPRNGPRRTS